MTLRDYLRRANGYHRQQTEQWRHTRLLATVLLNVNRASDDAPLTPEEVMPLPGDAPAVVAMSEETFTQELARVAVLDSDWL